MENYNAANYSIREQLISHLLDGSLTDENREWWIENHPDWEPEIIETLKLRYLLLQTQKRPVSVNKQVEWNKLATRINAGKVRHLPKNLIKYAASILILMSLLTALTHIDSIRYKTYTSVNPKERIELSDHSVVDLQQGALLKVPRFFNRLNRNVKLTGEAYFKVSKQHGVKFTVQASNCEITVLGTQFLVKNEPDNILVSVNEGKVAFSLSTEDQSIILTKNQSAAYTKSNRIQSVAYQTNQSAWATGVFEFKNAPLADIFKTLEPYYHVQFKPNKALAQQRISIYIPNLSVDELLQLMQEIIPELTYNQQDKTITIK